MWLKRGNVERIAEDFITAEKLKKEGYVPINGSIETVAIEKPRQDIGSLTLQELKEEAKKRGLKGYSSLTKEQLLDALKVV